MFGHFIDVSATAVAVNVTLGDLAENVIHVFSWALKRVWRQCHYSKHQIYTIGIMPAHRYGRY